METINVLPCCQIQSVARYGIVDRAEKVAATVIQCRRHNGRTIRIIIQLIYLT